MSYKDAYELMREKRAIVSPNLGFMVQLMMFHQRLNDENPDPHLRPKIFALSSHQIEDPQTIVARLLYDENLYLGKRKLALDPRGVFLIGGYENGYLWKGAECLECYREKYLSKARDYLKCIQKYEKFPKIIEEIDQGQEDIEFWKALKLDSVPEPKYAYNPSWNKWLVNF